MKIGSSGCPLDKRNKELLVREWSLGDSRSQYVAGRALTFSAPAYGRKDLACVLKVD